MLEKGCVYGVYTTHMQMGAFMESPSLPSLRHFRHSVTSVTGNHLNVSWAALFAAYRAGRRRGIMNTGQRFLGRALPYGVHALADGSRICFDRKYRPLAHVWPDGTVVLQDPSVPLEHAPAAFFYTGKTAPYRRLPMLRKLCALADELGLMAHVKQRARADYEEYCGLIGRKPRRTRSLE